MDSTTSTILLITFLVGVLMTRKLLTMYYTKKLVNAFTDDPDCFEKKLDSAPVRLLFEVFNREFMRLNFYITYSKKGKIDEQAEKLDKIKLNRNQKFSVFQLLLQYYISTNQENKARKLQKRYNAFVDENKLDKVLKNNMEMELKIHFNKDITTLSYIDMNLEKCSSAEKVAWNFKKAIVLKANNQIEEAKACIQEVIEHTHDEKQKEMMQELLNHDLKDL